MGFLKKIKDGNYGFIARNCTQIYLILKDKQRHKNLSTEALLVITALIDTTLYIQSGKFGVDDVHNYVRHLRIRNSELFDEGDEWGIFLEFVVMLEKVLFRIDSNLSSSRIDSSVESMRDVIKQNINDAWREYRDGRVAKRFVNICETFLDLKATQPIKAKLGIR